MTKSRMIRRMPVRERADYVGSLVHRYRRQDVRVVYRRYSGDGDYRTTGPVRLVGVFTDEVYGQTPHVLAYISGGEPRFISLANLIYIETEETE